MKPGRAWTADACGPRLRRGCVSGGRLRQVGWEGVLERPGPRGSAWPGAILKVLKLGDHAAPSVSAGLPEVRGRLPTNLFRLWSRCYQPGHFRPPAPPTRHLVTPPHVRRTPVGTMILALPLDSIFKSREITLPTKVRLVKAMVFPVVMYGCESWTVKKAELRRIDACELWWWRRSNQSILKEISPGISLEGMMLKLKLQYFGHLM